MSYDHITDAAAGASHWGTERQSVRDAYHAKLAQEQQGSGKFTALRRAARRAVDALLGRPDHIHVYRLDFEAWVWRCWCDEIAPEGTVPS